MSKRAKPPFTPAQREKRCEQSEQTSLAGVEQREDRGLLLFTVHDSEGHGLEGVSVIASMEADGPFYLDELGLPSATASATTATGLGFFVNATPGTASLTFDGASCAPDILGWASDSGDVDAPVEALAVTDSRARCQ